MDYTEVLDSFGGIIEKDLASNWTSLENKLVITIPFGKCLPSGRRVCAQGWQEAFFMHHSYGLQRLCKSIK